MSLDGASAVAAALGPWLVNYSAKLLARKVLGRGVLTGFTTWDEGAQ